MASDIINKLKSVKQQLEQTISETETSISDLELRLEIERDRLVFVKSLLEGEDRGEAEEPCELNLNAELPVSLEKPQVLTKSDQDNVPGDGAAESSISEKCSICGDASITVEGVCYDCAVLCKVCGEEPAHPETKICPKCATRYVVPKESSPSTSVVKALTKVTKTEFVRAILESDSKWWTASEVIQKFNAECDAEGDVSSTLRSVLCRLHNNKKNKVEKKKINGQAYYRLLKEAAPEVENPPEE
jgi:hypothetical protein